MPPPDRNREVYFVGAGLSSAAGLPNTPSLIDAVLALAKQNRSPVTEEQLLRAFKFFYPDAVHVGFRPRSRGLLLNAENFPGCRGGLRGNGVH